MTRLKKSVIAVVCMVLLCVIVAGCAAGGPGEETIQTVYLPETYKYVGYRQNNNWEKEEVSVEKQLTYDAQGRCIGCVVTEDSEKVGHWVQTFTFEYDEYGNLVRESCQSRTEKNGSTHGSDTVHTLRYTYDENGRAKQCESEKVVNYSTGETKTFAETFAFSYDKQGNLVTLTVGTEGECWYYYSYDSEGRMIAETVCSLLPEDYPQADQYRYMYEQTVFVRNDQGKVTGEEQLYTYSVERVGADGLDQLEFRSNGKGYYTFYYDEDGNLTGVNKKDQYQYDENGQWIPEDQFTTINYRGEMVEQVLAKYTQDEHGNIIKFENHQYTEEITYTTRELTKSQAARTERFFNHRTLLGEYCMMPDYVFRNFYPDWQEGVTYMHYFMDLFKNLPW